MNDCRLPIAVMLGGGPFLLLLLFFSLRKQRFATDDAVERKRRVGVAILTVTALSGAWFMATAWLLCRAGAVCAAGWELNCRGTMGQIYAAIAALALLFAIAINAWDLRRRAIH